MRVLVIHPKDKTTDFLKIVQNPDFTIVRTDLEDSTLKSLVREHDVIVALGHGDEHGLFGYGRYIIDSTFSDILSEKICIFVWCFASDFVEKYKLMSPFSTGMFISEPEEAKQFNVKLNGSNEISFSNRKFAESLAFALVDMKHFEDYYPEMYSAIENRYIQGWQQSDLKHYNITRFYSNMSEESAWNQQEIERLNQEDTDWYHST